MKNGQVVNIVIPAAGGGRSFINAGYTFPKPLIDIKGKPMIQLVLENLKPKLGHKFIIICQKDHFDQYSLSQVFHNSTKGNFESIQLSAPTQGAACSVLTAIDFINNDCDLIIANADQLIDINIDKFIKFARVSKADGVIMTFNSLHPRWSYARVGKKNTVLEVAEKKVISEHATVGIYYFKKGSDFVKGALLMISKNIRFNGDFYVCPIYNELILEGKKIITWEIGQEQMHSLGTPEDLNIYFSSIEKKGKSKKKKILNLKPKKQIIDPKIRIVHKI